MPPSSRRPDPPYLRIAAELRARILSGALRPGDRVPSARQIAERWDVAIATATKVMAALRAEGLVEARVGSGTVVSASPAPDQPPGVPRQALNREQVVRAAMAIADREGLAAVSIRRLAIELGVRPMSLYRHVATKDELVAYMTDEAFGEPDLPVPGPDGWRPKLELISRSQWALCRRHTWLPRAVSFTRPMLVPNMMAHTEWTLRALDGLGLPMTTRVQEALTLHALVVTVAIAMANEAEAEQETGVSSAAWWWSQRSRTDDLLARFPLLAAVPERAAADLDGLFEYGLARHLDGLAVLIERGQPR
ncbi:TetR/AcrR family transcriptional regulator C-terminal domain-containing protein [Actinoplanes aureus]|uniref:TetR/AcrR family transcriptional regulator C-terminal domain-containing protein n=1 Tax=Actinoplanes aureus TaxID=2792083 RepID=A0A931CAN8_9ACTN|nr:GntR family transcriptional regulator [Actinoplanes aureus]MBG0561385.1 TetR/AcrR family transcriptional regulator C-terminal domain-containing protein [Actinoplanes aureus]